MSKLTRRFKKNKNNKTNKSGLYSLKRGGSYPEKHEIMEDKNDERKGVIDIVEDKASSIASSAATAVADTGLRLVGLERVNKNSENNETDENINKINDNASGFISKASNVLDKTGAVILDNVNEVLGSNNVKETTEQAAEKTAEIVKESAEKFNTALDKPEVKDEVKKALENASEIGSVVVKAAEKPFNEAVDVAAKASQKATGAALSGIVKVGTDVLAAVPFFGAIIDAGKMVNDGSRAASAVFEAGSEATEAAADAFIETKKNVENGLKLLEEKKKIGDQTLNRVNTSMKEFENSNTSQSAGGHKTRRRLLKRKAKSKRVRFAI